MRFPTVRPAVRYAVGFAIGLVTFVVAPEGVRWLHGSAVAQQTLSNIPGMPPNTTVGTVVGGDLNSSVTIAPGQTAQSVVGAESSVTACPGRSGSVVGTYIPPGGHMSVDITNNGTVGSATGFLSSVTVGGPGCN